MANPDGEPGDRGAEGPDPGTSPAGSGPRTTPAGGAPESPPPPAGAPEPLSHGEQGRRRRRRRRGGGYRDPGRGPGTERTFLRPHGTFARPPPPGDRPPHGGASQPAGAGIAGPPPARTERNLPALLVLLLILGVLLASTVMIFLPFVTPIALALVITTVAYPLHARVLRLVGGARRGLAAALTCVVLLVLVFAPLLWIGWEMVNQARAGVEQMGRGIVRLTAWVEEQSWFQNLSRDEKFQSYWRTIQSLGAAVGLTGREDAGLPAEPEGEGPAGRGAPAPAGTPDAPRGAAEERPVTRPPAGGAGPEASGEQSPGAVAEDAFPLGKSLARWITSTAAGLVANAFEVLLKFLLMLFILFYFFKDGAEILKSIENAIPLDRASQERVVTTFRRVSQSVVRGSFLTALAQGAVATVAFAIVGLPAIFWGVMAAFCALIPPIGTSLVTIPLTISFLVHQEWWQGIFLGVVSVAIGTMDNFLKPYLVGGSLHMHPIWLLLSILGAMRLFGPLGIIYGPLVLVLLGTFVALLVRAEGSRALGSTVGGGKEAQT